MLGRVLCFLGLHAKHVYNTSDSAGRRNHYWSCRRGCGKRGVN